MSKRLLALVEVLMAISIFCTGYASWSFAAQRSATVSGSDFFEVFDGGKNEIPVSLDDFGVGITTDITGVGKSRNFQYKVVSTANEERKEFSNTSLSIWFKVDIDAMAAFDKQDYNDEALLVTCTAEEYNDQQEDFIVRSFAPGDGVGLWLEPTAATLYVAGYPNVSRTVAWQVNSRGQLEMTIPLAELYNLLLPCQKGEITEGGATYLPVELVIDFTPTPEGESDTITRPCSWQYTFSAQLTPNT